MKTKFNYSVILAIIFSISTAFSVSAQQRTNLLDKMNNADWKALNIFFSNFCETNFNDFNAKSYDEKVLIEHALYHNVVNSSNSFKNDPATGDKYLTKATVDATIMKAFGISGIKAKDFEADFFACKGGKYYWLDIFEGSPWFAGGQVIEFYENGDGTYSAIIENYSDSSEYQEYISGLEYSSKSSKSPFYSPKKTWKKGLEKYYKLDGYHAAKVAPQTYNNKATYKLLGWKSAETLKEAQNSIK